MIALMMTPHLHGAFCDVRLTQNEIVLVLNLLQARQLATDSDDLEDLPCMIPSTSSRHSNIPLSTQTYGKRLLGCQVHLP